MEQAAEEQAIGVAKFNAQQNTQMAQHMDNLRMAQAKLQQDAYMNQMDFMAKQQQLQQNSQLMQHRLAIDKAYKDAMVGVSQKKVMNESLQLAQKFAAQQEFDQLVKGGMKPEDAMLRVGPKMGLSGASMGSIISAIARNRAQVPATYGVENIGGEDFMVTHQPTGHVQASRIQSGKPTANVQVQVKQREIDKIDKTLENPLAKKALGEKGVAEKEARRKQLASEIEEIIAGVPRTAAPTAASRPEVPKSVAAPSGPVHVKDKKTGKKFTYHGRKEDIPTDKYEILD